MEKISPVYLGALGVAPLVAISKTFLSGLMLGLVFTVTLLVTALVISSIRAMIPQVTRLAYILIVSSTCVTSVDLITRSLIYELNISVNIYLSLVTINCLLIYLLEAKALKLSSRSVISVILPASVLMVFICVLVGALREIFSQGRIFTDIEKVSEIPGSGITLLPDLLNMAMFNTAAGAFIVTGCVFALINAWLNSINKLDR